MNFRIKTLGAGGLRHLRGLRELCRALGEHIQHGIDAVLKNNELEKTSESSYLDGPWDWLTSWIPVS